MSLALAGGLFSNQCHLARLQVYQCTSDLEERNAGMEEVGKTAALCKHALYYSLQGPTIKRNWGTIAPSPLRVKVWT